MMMMIGGVTIPTKYACKPMHGKTRSNQSINHLPDLLCPSAYIPFEKKRKKGAVMVWMIRKKTSGLCRGGNAFFQLIFSLVKQV